MAFSLVIPAIKKLFRVIVFAIQGHVSLTCNRYCLPMRSILLTILAKCGILKMTWSFWLRFWGLVNRCQNHKLLDKKYIHIMLNDKFNKPFVDFLNSYFDPSEHLIMCKRCCPHPFPVGDNVIEVKSFRGFDFSCKTIRYLIFHSLGDEEMIDILYKHKEWLPKSLWLVWGGDLYNAVRDIKNDFVRSHIGTYVVVAESDGDIARQRYNSEARCFFVCYNVPITWEMIQFERNRKHETKDSIRIQINNSCDASTVEMLRLLAKYRFNSIEVCTILSYGHLECRDLIIATGSKLFGSKFSCALSYMDPAEYVTWMANVDILVLNQDRQQGLGNISLALALGTKCFVKSTLSSFASFSAKGLRLYDTDDIARLPYEEFTKYEEASKQNNMRLSYMFYDDAEKEKQWREIFAS